MVGFLLCLLGLKASSVGNAVLLTRVLLHAGSPAPCDFLLAVPKQEPLKNNNGRSLGQKPEGDENRSRLVCLH